MVATGTANVAGSPQFAIAAQLPHPCALTPAAVLAAAARVANPLQNRPFAGPVPEWRLMRRVAQIGGGKIFGSEAFVVSTAFALGDRFRSRSVSARAVGELGYATHGWRLARAETAAQGAA